MTFPAGETLTILRRTKIGVDGYGNDKYGTTETPVPGCAVWPAGPSANNDARDTVFTGYTAVLPPDTQIAPTDKVRWGGAVYEVDGEPGTFRSPFTGSGGHVQVQLKRVTG